MLSEAVNISSPPQIDSIQIIENATLPDNDSTVIQNEFSTI